MHTDKEEECTTTSTDKYKVGLDEDEEGCTSVGDEDKEGDMVIGAGKLGREARGARNRLEFSSTLICSQFQFHV